MILIDINIDMHIICFRSHIQLEPKIVEIKSVKATFLVFAILVYTILGDIKNCW